MDENFYSEPELLNLSWTRIIYSKPELLNLS